MNIESSRRALTGTHSGSLGATPFHQHRLTITEVDGVWRDAVVQRLEELVRLEPGWDGYNGLPVTFENAMFTVSMLEATCRTNTVPPQIIPGSSGEVQIEWHTENGDVEILVRGPYNVRAWSCFVGSPDPDGEEIELTKDFLLVAKWINEITEPKIAVRAAA